MIFNGKIALVSGGTRGIGSTVAKRLIDEGAFCYITGRDRERGLDTEKVLGKSARYIRVDVTDEVAVNDLFNTIERDHGRLDLAVNNAGVTTKRASIQELDLDEWRRVLDINLVGPLLLMSRQIKLMSRYEEAAIVNVSSCGGVLGQPRQSAYSTSKAALNMLTQVAAVESANPMPGQHVIRVNAVCPGPTLGGMNTEERLQANPDSTKEKIQSTAMKRFANPEEITAAITWLLSAQASYVTGALLSVDGGFSAGKF
jgi:NAD(P)-dependent dehydrogenase (short-subunit alcohol dehydrogenase family)